jgi:hypothetical protein
LLYVPLGFVPAWNGDGLVPSYPTGFSLFVMVLKAVVGWRHAGDLTIILHSLAGLAATYALGRMLGLGKGWAALSAAIVASSPLYLFMSLQAMSDVPSLFWTTAAVLAALRSRNGALWALAAGGAVAMDVLLRPTNILALVPVGIALGGSPRRWMLLILGCLPGAVFLFAQNAAAYGSTLATGYGDISRLFSAGFVPETLFHYARWLPVLFTPIVVLALALPWLGGETARTRWLLGAWMVAFAAFYSAYWHTHEAWWYLRFLLPSAPAMVVAAMLVCRGFLSRILSQGGPGRSLIAFVAGLALVAANALWWGRDLDPLGVGKIELKYQLVSNWMTRNLPPNAVCVAVQATGALYFYTDFTFIRWDALDTDSVARIEDAVRSSGRPLYSVLFPYETLEFHVLEKRMPGHWIQVASVDDVAIWRREFDTAFLVIEESAKAVGYAVEGPSELRFDPKSGSLVRAAYGPSNWWLLENNGVDYWRWSKGDSSVAIHNPQPFPILADVSFGLATVNSRTATVTLNGKVVWRGGLRRAYDNQAAITGVELPPGDTVLFFQSDRPAVSLAGDDNRLFAFSVRNLKISLKGKGPSR